MGRSEPSELHKLASIIDGDFDIAENPQNYRVFLRRDFSECYFIDAEHQDLDKSRFLSFSAEQVDRYSKDEKFSGFFKKADEIYDEQGKENSRRQEEYEKKVKRNENRARGIAGLVTGIVLTAGAWLGVDHYTSPEYERVCELEKKAVFILPEINEQHSYEINGNRYLVERTGTPYSNGNCRLQIKVNDELGFISEYGIGESFSEIDQFLINTENGWEFVSMEQAGGKEELQKLYDSAIDIIGETKSKDMDERLTKTKDRIQKAKEKL